MIKPIITYHPNGNKYYEHYYLNDNLHNDNGPAKVCYYYKNGNKQLEGYCLNGELHNNNGPAKVCYYENGYKELEQYWLNGKFLEDVHSLEELKKYIKLNNIS